MHGEATQSYKNKDFGTQNMPNSSSLIKSCDLMPPLNRIMVPQANLIPSSAQVHIEVQCENQCDNYIH